MPQSPGNSSTTGSLNSNNTPPATGAVPAQQSPTGQYQYELVHLLKDQRREFVKHLIAPLISWIDPDGTCTQPVCIDITDPSQVSSTPQQIYLTWDLSALEAAIPELKEDLSIYRSKATALYEKQAELAAYCLAFVATTCFLKIKVLAFNYYAPPDLQFDLTPGALRGVEVAGRTSGGYSALNAVRNDKPGKFLKPKKGRKKGRQKSKGKPGKRSQMLSRIDIAEGYLSLWCATPRVSYWEKVK